MSTGAREGVEGSAEVSAVQQAGGPQQSARGTRGQRRILASEAAVCGSSQGAFWLIASQRWEHNFDFFVCYVAIRDTYRVPR